MAIGDKTRWYQRHAFGSPWDKNIRKVSFGYTHTYKQVAAASTTAVHAAISSAFTAQTVTTGITNPDVPRVLSITTGGTAADIGAGIVTITGTNVEGKTITDDFKMSDGTAETINGTKAFKTVTQIAIPAMEGTGATVAVGYLNRIGLNHRLFPNNTTVKVVQDTGSARTLQGTPTINDADETYIEKNFITPATTPDGTTFLTIYYSYDNWTLGDLYDEPDWITTTSTSSTSSSTSTTTVTTSTSSTSTSSTSTSTSSTSTSTSSTSSSTSSTSTSTTTVP